MQTQSNVGRHHLHNVTLKDAGILIKVQHSGTVHTQIVKQEQNGPGQLLRNIEIIQPGWMDWGVKYFQLVQIFSDSYNYNFIASLIVIYGSPNEKQQ